MTRDRVQPIDSHWIFASEWVVGVGSRQSRTDLLDVTENTTFQQREMNRSFVQMQYFGYLRRNPNDAPDEDFAGYDFWVDKLNAAGGDFITSEMVKAFLVSIEYRDRFGR